MSLRAKKSGCNSLWKELERKTAIIKIGIPTVGGTGNSTIHPLEITEQQMFDEKLLYIHQNPVQAGFVIKEEDWKYSSARDFCERFS